MRHHAHLRPRPPALSRSSLFVESIDWVTYQQEFGDSETSLRCEDHVEAMAGDKNLSPLERMNHQGDGVGMRL